MRGLKGWHEAVVHMPPPLLPSLSQKKAVLQLRGSDVVNSISVEERSFVCLSLCEPQTDNSAHEVSTIIFRPLQMKGEVHL